MLQPPLPTLAVLDAMLFVERRFGEGLSELPDLLAVPDEATRCRLLASGAPDAAVVVTGNPTLEEIGKAPSPGPYCPPLRGRGEQELAHSPSPAHRERGLGGEGRPSDVCAFHRGMGLAEGGLPLGAWLRRAVRRPGRALPHVSRSGDCGRIL